MIQEENISHVFNPYIFSIMGITFEVIGALFLSMEAIGIKKFASWYNRLKLFSKWSKSKYINLVIIFSPFFCILTLALFYDFVFFSALVIPIIVFFSLVLIVLEDPGSFERWVIIKTKEKEIGPVGFILLFIGNLLQLIKILISLPTS